MALINCPECSKQVSDKAPACPNCGYPIADSLAKNPQPSQDESKQVIPEIQKQQIQSQKQVTPQAIEAAFNKQLNPKNITAKVALRDSCLQVLLESKQLLPQSPIVTGIKKFLTTINPAGIEKVKIYYKQLGDDFPKWDEEIELTTSISKIDKLLPLAKNIEKAVEKDISTLPELQKKIQDLVDPLDFLSTVDVSENHSFGKTLNIKLTRTYRASSKPDYLQLYLKIKPLISGSLARGFSYLKIIAKVLDNLEWQEVISIDNLGCLGRSKIEGQNTVDEKSQNSIVHQPKQEVPIIPEILEPLVEKNAFHQSQYQESRPTNYEPQLRCPKCSSTQLMPAKKGYSLGKAVVGGLLTGGVGLLGGFWGSNDIRLNCLNCGHKWQPR